MYQTIVLGHFKRQLKPYLKKHRDLKDAVIKTLEHFDPRQHDRLGGSVYKIRLKIASLPKGKSKSFRLVILIMESEGFLVPLAIYFKSDRDSMSKKEINDHLQQILLELRTRVI